MAHTAGVDVDSDIDEYAVDTTTINANSAAAASDAAASTSSHTAAGVNSSDPAAINADPAADGGPLDKTQFER